MVSAQICEVLSVNSQRETHNNLFSSVNLQKHHGTTSKTHARKKRYCAPISLYSNHCISFKLILSVDIETNPGPNQRISCSIYEKTIRKNFSRYDCQVCKESTYAKCLKKICDVKVNHWTCSRCISVELPFHNTRDMFDKINPNILNDTLLFELPTVSKLNQFRQHFPLLTWTLNR